MGLSGEHDNRHTVQQIVQSRDCDLSSSLATKYHTRTHHHIFFSASSAGHTLFGPPIPSQATDTLLLSFVLYSATDPANLYLRCL